MSVLILMALVLSTRIISPLANGQVFGVVPIEVETGLTNVDRVEIFVDGALAGVARHAPWRIPFDFGTSPAAREVVAKAYANGYRDKETATVITAAITAGETLAVDVVEVPLRIRANGVVRAGDIRIRENDVEQTPREVRAERPPAHFAFIVDRSLSMGEGRLPAALRAIDAERKLLREGDTASLILFNHNVSAARVINRTDSLATLFRDIVPSGGTSLRDALASVAARDRTYAIVITDGGDRNSLLSDEKSLRRISGTKTVVDAIVLGAGSGFLRRATANTGGRLIDARAATLQRALHALIVDINSRYLVVYQSRGTARGWRTIAVASRRAGVEITNARKGYFAE